MNNAYKTKKALFTIALLSMSALTVYAIDAEENTPADVNQDTVEIQKTTTTTTVKRHKPLTPKTQNGITYISGGIGEGEEDAIKTVGKDYNLHLVYSVGKGNSYTTGVNVEIINTRSKESVFLLKDAGPLVYLDIPKGKYEIRSGSTGQQTKKRILTVNKKHIYNLSVHWDQEGE